MILIRVSIIQGITPAFPILDHEDVNGGLWASLWLAPFILLSLAIFQTFWLDHPHRLILSYDDFLALGRLSLRWHLLPVESPGTCLCEASFGDSLQILIVFHLWSIELVDEKHCNC
jgi:hypothetical protein